MKTKNREYLKDLLESQIKYDITEGDTTVLAEIISTFTDEEIFNLLSDENQEQAKHFNYIVYSIFVRCVL